RPTAPLPITTGLLPGSHVIRRSCEREDSGAIINARWCASVAPQPTVDRLAYGAQHLRNGLEGKSSNPGLKRRDPPSSFISHQPPRISDTRVVRSERQCGDSV